MNPIPAPVLSVDTATPVCSVALLLPDGTILEERTEEKGVHSEMTFLFIRKLLDDAGLLVKDLGAVLVSGGPGSYTGLRIGGSAVKGLLFQSDVSMYAYNTLAGIALGAVYEAVKSTDPHAAGDGEMNMQGVYQEEHQDVYIDAVIDARRNHLYHQAWHFSDNGMSSVTDIKTIELEEILDSWLSGRLIAGTGSERLIRLAESRGINLKGLPPFRGTKIISAASMLGYVGGDPEKYCVAGETDESTDARQYRNMIRKVNPSVFQPAYFSGM